MITVYYSNIANLFSHDPEPLAKSFFDHHDADKKYDLYTKDNLFSLKGCPGFVEYCNNIFVLKNLIDYSIRYSAENSCSSQHKDQQFYDKWVLLRGQPGLISYKYPHHIFYAEKSLEIELTGPSLHNCDLNKKAIVIPGRYNIGKHFRPLDCAFKFNAFDNIEFKESEPYMYVRFLTNEKVRIKNFFMTNTLFNIMSTIMELKTTKNKPLSFWYDLHEKSYRKKILREINENLV